MNTIFIDFNHDSKKTKVYKFKKKYLKYLVNDDILNNVFSKNTYISFDKEYILNQLEKTKYSIYDKILKFNINRKYKKDEEVYLIFSKEFDGYKVAKEYILNLFRLNSVTRYYEVGIPNKLKEHDILYIDKYVNDKKIDINRLKILVVIDNINDYDQRKILEYISKYKFLDILKTNNINKYDLKKLEKSIENINNEYGTTIDIIKKRNLQKYDVCLIHSNLEKLEFYQKYILSSTSLYINIKDVDSDVLSEEYIRYERYEPEILTLLKRLNINKDNFSKVKLGFLFK